MTEANRTRPGQMQHGPVDPAGVVAQQQDAALGRDVLETSHGQPVVLGKDDAQQEAHERLRQFAQGAGRADGHDRGQGQG